MKIFILIFLALLNVGADSCNPDMPRMPRKPRIYTGASEKVGACRLIGEELECISATTEAFNDLECTPKDDAKMGRDYIILLSTSCEKWKRAE